MSLKAEIFSIRKSSEFVDDFDTIFDETVSELNANGINVLFKTDVDPNGGKIKEALDVSTNEQDPPEMIVVVNALSTSGSESFKDLFSKAVLSYEKAYREKHSAAENKSNAGGKKAKTKSKTTTKKKVKIHSLGDCGNGYRGYFFMYNGVKIITLPETKLSGVSYGELICHAIEKTNSIFEETNKKYPDGFTEVEVKAEKTNFFLSFIPLKKDSLGEKIRKSVVLMALAAVLVSGYMLANTFLIEPAINRQIMNDMKKIYESEVDSDEPEQTDESGVTTKTKNWKDLKKINSDIVGWIHIDNTVIDYPVLENKNDTSTSLYYLKRDVYKNYNENGSIFIDYRSSKSVDSKNVILHGHHMMDGSMFGNLLKYGGFSGDLNFMKKSPIIEFNTPDGNAMWKIISVFKTNTLNEHGEFFNYMQGSFDSDAQFMNFVYNIRVRSLFDMPVTVNADDQLLTLSTCSYEYSDFRTVVVARKVRPDENYSVETSKIKLNPNPLWPDVRGGYKPSVTTFLTEYDKSSDQVSWFDGKTRPEGTEDLSRDAASIPDKEKIRYTVTWINWDGTVLKEEVVDEGKSASPPPNPTRPDWGEYKYVFKEWEWKDQWSKVICPLTIAPVFEEVKK